MASDATIIRDLLRNLRDDCGHHDAPETREECEAALAALDRLEALANRCGNDGPPPSPELLATFAVLGQREAIDLDAYWQAPAAGSEMHGAWQNKPHRLLYDLIGEAIRLRRLLADAQSLALRPMTGPPVEGDDYLCRHPDSGALVVMTGAGESRHGEPVLADADSSFSADEVGALYSIPVAALEAL